MSEYKKTDKVARLRIQIDVEVLSSPLYGDPSDPEFFKNQRFFFEENHCVENETRRALELLIAHGERESKNMRERLGINGTAGVCVTCHGAEVTLLAIEDAPEKTTP